MRSANPVGAAGGPVDEVTAGRIRRSPGTPMDPQLRRSMESGFGADLSAVRFHVGDESTRLNEQLGAQAFAVGDDIFFRDGEPDTATPDGQHLVAHEIAHTLQSGTGAQRSVQSIRRLAETPEQKRDRVRNEYFAMRDSLGDEAVVAELVPKRQDLLARNAPPGFDTGVRSVMWEWIEQANSHFGAGEYELATSALRNARTLVRSLGARGVELVSARAGKAETAEQLQDLVAASDERRAAALYSVFLRARGKVSSNGSTLNSVAQWLSDGQGGKVGPAYRLLWLSMQKAPGKVVLPEGYLHQQINTLFGAGSPSAAYLLEIAEHGRVGPKGHMLSALRLLGRGKPKRGHVLTAAKSAPPDVLNEILTTHRAQIEKADKDLVPALEALADKQAIDQTVRAVAPIGLTAADVVSDGDRKKIEIKYLDSLLAMYGDNRDKLLPELIQWSSMTDPAIVNDIVEARITKYYEKQAASDAAMALDVEFLTKMLIGATGVKGLDDQSPDSESSQSGRRFAQLDSLLADQYGRSQAHADESKNGPPGAFTQLLTSPTMRPDTLLDMIESVLADGEVVRELVARHGDVATARRELGVDLAKTNLSAGQADALLERVFFGEHRAGSAYAAVAHHVFDKGAALKAVPEPITDPRRAVVSPGQVSGTALARKRALAKQEKYIRHLVGLVAALEPGERDLVRRHDELVAAIKSTCKGDSVDPTNWWIILGTLGLTKSDVDAATRRVGQNPPARGGRAAQGRYGVQGLTVNPTGDPDDTTRTLQYQSSGEDAADGGEAQTTAFWSARVTSVLSKKYGSDKNVVSAVALLQEAGTAVADPRRTLTEIGTNLGAMSSDWKKRLDEAGSQRSDEQSAKRRVAFLLKNGEVPDDADVLHVHAKALHSAKGRVTKLQTSSGALTKAWLALPPEQLLLKHSNINDVVASMGQDRFPTRLLDLNEEAHAELTDSLKREKRVEALRIIRDRLAEVAAEPGSQVEVLFLSNGLSKEQAQLFAIQTRVLGDLDKERLLLSGAQWVRFNNLSQMRREARNEELGALRGARSDMTEAPSQAVSDKAKGHRADIEALSDTTREAQGEFTAMRKRYRDRIVLAISALLGLAFSIVSVGAGLPAAAAWIQILATTLFVVAQTAAVQVAKWAVMGDSQSLVESIISVLFSIPTGLVAGFVAGPLGFSADVGLRMALEGLKEGAPFLEIALRSFLVGNINRILNKPVDGLQSWLTSEKDPEGAMHRLKGDIVDELKGQVKAIGLSVLKGLAKTAVPEGVRESDITPSDDDTTAHDDRSDYLDPFSGGGDVGSWATYRFSPTDDMIGASAGFRQGLADVRNLGIEMAFDWALSQGGKTSTGDLSQGSRLDTSALTPAASSIFQTVNAAYARAFFAAEPDEAERDQFTFASEKELVDAVKPHLKALVTRYGLDRTKALVRTMHASWTSKRSTLHGALVALPRPDPDRMAAL